jgi:hypothetical protein
MKKSSEGRLLLKAMQSAMQGRRTPWTHSQMLAFPIGYMTHGDDEVEKQCTAIAIGLRREYVYGAERAVGGDCDELIEALRECSDRLQKCCVASGTFDEEFALAAVQKYRDLLAKYPVPA